MSDHDRVQEIKNTHGLGDSGARESFATGMVREPNLSRGRYDLITPVGLLNTMLNMTNPNNLTSLVLKRLAIHYERGAMKYADRNWEKGGPLSRHLNSAFRHLNNVLEGDTSEDHYAACIWNLWCIMHHRCLSRRDIDDLVCYKPDEIIVWVGPEEGALLPISKLNVFMYTGRLADLAKACEACMIRMNEEVALEPTGN